MSSDLFQSGELFLIAAAVLVTLFYSIRMGVVDARRRGRSPLLVAALMILFFPVGLLIWLAVRPARIDVA
jgi:hypothetical protein